MKFAPLFGVRPRQTQIPNIGFLEKKRFLEKIETRSGTNMKFAPHFRIRPRLTTLHQKKKVLQGWSRVFNTDVPEIIISFVDHGDYLFWVTNLMMMSQYFSIRTWFGNKTWKWAAAPLPHHPTRACWRAFLLRILIVNILSIFSSFLSISTTTIR